MSTSYNLEIINNSDPFVIYFFFLTTCQYLSALTARIMANEPLMSVYIFPKKRKTFIYYFCFPCWTKSGPNRDPKTKIHTEP